VTPPLPYPRGAEGDSVPGGAPRRSRRLEAWIPAHGAVPVWFAPAVLALAAGAAVALPGRPAGLALALLGAGLLAAVAAAAPNRDVFAIGCWSAASLLAAVPAVRAAGWVAALSLLAALALAAVAAAGSRTWREVGAGLAGATAGLLPGPLLVLVLLARRAGARSWGWLGPAARGALLAALLLAVFVPLLAAADAAFATIVDAAVAWDLDVDRPVARAGAALLALAVGGALLLVALRRRERPARPVQGRLGRAEWVIALVALDVTFAAFVAVQFATLFGGHDHVLGTAGLTYAEYARSGFFQLEVVAALTLAVVAGAARWARRETTADDRVARALLALLCVLTLVMLASALRRLGLYEEAFGATRLRLLVHVQLLWLAAVFLLLLVAGAARDGARLPRAIVAVSATAALGFAASDPDARIAERNVQRHAETGRIDVRYLNTLSADAARAIAHLPPDVAACAAEDLRRSLRESDGLAGANAARARARRALAPLAGAVCGS
jgi:Domain of unknown function (DUF4153)